MPENPAQVGIGPETRLCYNGFMNDALDNEAISIPDRDLARNIWFNNANGIAFTLAFNLFNPFLGIFALKLGAPDSYVALLSSLPAATSILAMLPAARFIDRLAEKKRITAWFIALNRVFYLLIALLPWLSPRHAALWLVLLVGLMNIPGSIAGVAWQSFIAGIIPPSMRNGVFAHRNLLMGAAGLIPLVAAGPLIDWLGSPLGYQVAFGLASVMAIAEVAFFLGIREKAPAAAAARGRGAARTDVLSPSALRLRLLGTVRRYPAYWRFSLAAVFFHVAWIMSWPLFTIYNVDVLGANNSWISAINVVAAVASILTYRAWGRLADRIGTQPATALAALGLAGFPILVAFSHTILGVTILNAYVGVFGGAIGFLLQNSMLDVAPEQNRTGYIAIYNTLINVAAAVSPLLGVALLQVMTIQSAFVLSGVLRALGGLAFYVAYRSGRRYQPAASGSFGG